MKKLLLLIILTISNLSYSQSENELTYNQQLETSSKNKLAKYFKKNISKKLLKNVRHAKNKDYIILSFYVNNENKPYRISTNTFSNFKLKKAIIEAFKKYPVKNLNVDSLRRDKLYFLQVIAKEDGKNIFKTSNKLHSKELPKLSTCNNLEFYEDIYSCTKEKIKKHFYDNLDFSIANNINEEEITINVSFFVGRDGKLKTKKIKSPIAFKENIKKVTNIFPSFLTQAKIDNKTVDQEFYFYVTFTKDDTPVYEKKKSFYDSVFKPNSTNEFSQYLMQNLSSEDLKKANLNSFKKRLILSFELDRKKKPFNIYTSSRSYGLEEKIISLFKNYPIDKFKFQDVSSLNRYSVQILSFNKNEIIVNTNVLIAYEKTPAFPGCENSKNISDARKCFSKGVQMHFAKNFDAKLPNKLGLSYGKKRIFISFRINKEGKIEKVLVRAPHPAIKAEVKKVMYTMPEVKPGYQANKAVNVKYSIPFTLIIE